MSQLFRKRLLATTLLVNAAAIASPAFAQTNPNQTAAPASAPAAGATDAATLPNPTDDTGAIVVTGSLIKNPNLRSAAPVQVVGREEIQLRQSNTAEELIRDLPGVVPSIGSAVNNGNGGASFVDLRGLGQQRNLVLLDGSRLVPADITGPVDLNNIPLALIERVDVLTGGSAVTYGADAVSGVVNFITRQDFSGIEINSGNQIDQRGDGREFRTDVTIGGNFDDGKGNAVLSVGYQQQSPVYQGDRKYSEFNIGSFTGTAGGSGTTTPTRFGGFGLVGSKQINPATGALGPLAVLFNYNPYNLFLTPFRRYNIFGQAHYDVSDKVSFYTRGLFSKNTVHTILAPGGAFNATSVAINYNNPYLPLAAEQQFCTANGLTAAQCTAARNATGPADPNYRTFTTNIARRTPELGNRVSNFTTTLFDYKAGFKYNFTDSLTLDVGGNYGQSENIATATGNLRVSRLRAATLASSTTSCDSPTAALIGAGYAASSDGGCVPVNLFGPTGSITSDEAAFLAAQTSVSEKSTLAQAHAVLSGDVGVSSPYASNPIGFALGVEYRKYTGSQSSDVLSQTPGEISGSGGAAPNISGSYDVQEVYGEVNVPLIDDKPFFKQLSIDGGARYSHYKVNTAGSPTFNTTTYMGKGSWQPVEGVTLRGNYQHAVRAPSISELFSPIQTFLTNYSTDPCATVASNGTTRVAPALTGALLATCQAQIGGANAASLVQGIFNDPGGQINAYGGGNLALKPEKSNSYTAGIVLAPRGFARNFTFSADYFHIRITDAITSPTPGDAVNACFNDPSPTSTACLAIHRDPTTGNLAGDPATVQGIPLTLSNLGTLFTDGVDVTANYRYDFGPARLNLNFSGTWTNRQQFQATPTSTDAHNNVGPRDCVGLYSVNCPGSGSLIPEFYWNARATVSVKAVDFSVLWRHISHMKEEFGAQACGSTDAQGGANDCGGPNFTKIPAFNYMDLSARIGAGDHLEFTVTVQNALDKKPPIVGTGVGSTAFNSGNTYPSTYDALGRRFLMGANVKF
jgi:iron complex outermembrane receptor protein